VTERRRQKLVEPGKAEGSHELRSGGPQHARAATSGLRSDLVKQRGLTHPGLARQQQGATVLARLPHERPQDRKVAFTADDVMR